MVKLFTSKLFNSIYRPGYHYSKTGIMLSQISSKNTIQEDIFFDQSVNNKNSLLMSTMDQLNNRYGKGTLKMGAESASKKWNSQSNWRSPNYTGSWDELPIVKC